MTDESKSVLAPRIPAEVRPLASYISDEIEARGWTTLDVALRMGNSEDIGHDLLALDILMCVHKDGLLPDDRQLEKIASAFDVSPQYLRNLDTVWRENPSQRVPFTPPESIFGPISRRALIHVVKPCDTKIKEKIDKTIDGGPGGQKAET